MGQVEHIARRFPEFTTEHIIARRLDGTHRPTDSDAVAAASLARRLRALAQQTAGVELASVIRSLVNRHLHPGLGVDAVPANQDRHMTCRLPKRQCGLSKGWLDRNGPPRS
jgi:hypothetical protein